MMRLNSDPEFRRRNAEATRASNRARGPLNLLNSSERADYDFLKRKHGYTRPEAFRAIGREDLIA